VSDFGNTQPIASQLMMTLDELTSIMRKTGLCFLEQNVVLEFCPKVHFHFFLIPVGFDYSVLVLKTQTWPAPDFYFAGMMKKATPNKK
jgi:hypothetical protein